VITHPAKVLFPDDGITKGELASYYESIAPIMLPHIRARPVTMERYPAGIDKKGFWQKDVSNGFRVTWRPAQSSEEFHLPRTELRSLLSRRELCLARSEAVERILFQYRLSTLWYP